MSDNLKPLAQFGRWCLTEFLKNPMDSIDPQKASLKASDLGLVAFYQAFVGSPCDGEVEWRVLETKEAKALGE